MKCQPQTQNIKQKLLSLGAALMIALPGASSGGPLNAGLFAQQTTARAEHAEIKKDKEGHAQDQEEKVKLLFSNGKKFIYAKDWENAVKQFSEITSSYKHCRWMDSALYWQAFSQSKLSDVVSAVSRKLELDKDALKKLEILVEKYPDSRWSNDGKRLMMEIAESLAAQGIEVYREYIEDISERRDEEDSELKIMALQSLVSVNEEKGYVQIEKIMRSPRNPELRRHALMLLIQLETPRAAALLLKAAQSDPDPEVRQEAILFLAQRPGAETVDQLTEIYRKNAGNSEVKKGVVLGLAEIGTEKAADVLIELYKSEKNLELKKEILFVLGRVKTPKVQEFILGVLAEQP